MMVSVATSLSFFAFVKTVNAPAMMSDVMAIDTISSASEKPEPDAQTRFISALPS
jgi:hypothetical protein